MLSDIFWTLILSLIFMGLLAGIVLDHVVVQFPARRKLGPGAFADFKRAADTGNGLFLYPILAIGGFLLVLVSFTLVITYGVTGEVLRDLTISLALSIGVLVTTVFAAPIMLRVSKLQNSDSRVNNLMERFIRISYVRAIFVWVTALALLDVLVDFLI